MLIGECTYYVFVLSKYRKTWNNVIRLVIALQYNITSWSLQNQAVSDRINLHTYIQPCLAVTMFLETKLILRTSLETQGRSRLYYLRFPTMSSEYWPQIHELFLKDLSLKIWKFWRRWGPDLNFVLLYIIVSYYGVKQVVAFCFRHQH